MKLRSLFRLLRISTPLSLIYMLCAHGEIRNWHYDLRDQDKGTTEGVLKVTSARSRLQCMTLCMATNQCVTAGYVDNQCTLASKRIGGLWNYRIDSHVVSIGERLYSLRCVPRWSGMCRLLDVTVTGDTENHDGGCGGLYTLVNGMVADDRPVYVKGAQHRVLYHHRGYDFDVWMIGRAVDGLGFHYCYVGSCAPEMAECKNMKMQCLAWL